MLKRFHIYRSFLYSLQGLLAAWSETAFRQEVLLSIIIVPLALYLGHGAIAKALLLLSWLLVLVVELINSAIEAVVDRVGKEHHLLAKRAKDCASAAVFVMIVIAAIVWFILLA